MVRIKNVAVSDWWLQDSRHPMKWCHSVSWKVQKEEQQVWYLNTKYRDYRCQKLIRKSKVQYIGLNSEVPKTMGAVWPYKQSVTNAWRGWKMGTRKFACPSGSHRHNQRRYYQYRSRPTLIRKPKHPGFEPRSANIESCLASWSTPSLNLKQGPSRLHFMPLILPFSGSTFLVHTNQMTRPPQLTKPDFIHDQIVVISLIHFVFI